MKLSSLALGACAACAVQGEREAGCPAGETCSDQTPNGLFFLGAPLGDEPLGRMGPLPTAVGGTQTLRVLTAAAASSPPFATAFQATASGAQLGVGSVVPPDVTVEGLAAGQAFLRVVEPGSDVLFDRIALEVAPVSRVEVRPRSLGPTADADFADGGIDWAMLAGGSASLVVRLFAADDRRLADEGMSLSVVGVGLAAGAREAWDALRVTALSSASGVFAVRTGDGMRRDTTINIATAVSDVVSVRAVGAAVSTDAPQPAGTAVTYCFRATSGGKLVAGAAWSFAVSDGLTVRAGATPNCTIVRSEQPTAGLISVTASGVMRELIVSFVALKPAAQRASGGGEAAAGERARGR